MRSTETSPSNQGQRNLIPALEKASKNVQDQKQVESDESEFQRAAGTSPRSQYQELCPSIEVNRREG